MNSIKQTRGQSVTPTWGFT